MVQLPRHAVPGGQRVEAVQHLVRLHELVPTRQARGHHHLPRHAGHRGVHLQRSQSARIQLRNVLKRRLRVLPGVVRRRRHRARRVPHRGVLRIRQLRRHRRARHVHRTRAHHAIRRGGIRQRITRRHSHVPHLLRLVPRVAKRKELVDRITRGGGVRVHGRRVGRVHLRFEHGRSTRGDARPGRSVLAVAAQGVFALLDNRNVGRDPVPGRRPRAHQEPRTARPRVRLPRHAGARSWRADGKVKKTDGRRRVASSHQRLRLRLRRRVRRHRGAGAHRLLRPALRPRQGPVQDAHAHR